MDEVVLFVNKRYSISSVQELINNCAATFI